MCNQIGELRLYVAFVFIITFFYDHLSMLNILIIMIYLGTIVNFFKLCAVASQNLLLFLLLVISGVLKLLETGLAHHAAGPALQFIVFFLRATLTHYLLLIYYILFVII